MLVYFVRHGETALNVQMRHQHPSTPLSEKGMQQARMIAKRLTHIPIQLILTSPYARTLQTAEAIAHKTQVPLIQHKLFHERRMPTSFQGKSVSDPTIADAHSLLRKRFFDADFHYEDEENFSDVQLRANNALDAIHAQKRDHVAVVTHGYFLTVLIFTMLFGKDAEPKNFQSFREHTTHANTGLTMCEYKHDRWKVLTWNDYAHLGE